MKRTMILSAAALVIVAAFAGCGKDGAAGGGGDRDLASPAADTGTRSVGQSGEYYTCPMHPSVVSDKPGSCPVCGMDLVRKAAPPASPAKAGFYTCPMHPSVVSDKPGSCPVCGMDLVWKSGRTPGEAADAGLPAAVSLSPAQRVTANVATTVVSRRPLEHEIRAVGVVDYAEPLRVKVTARFAGRIERLHVATTGEVVRKGQPLFEIHSPELYAAEREFLLAAQAMKAPGAATDTDRLLMLDAAMERLHLHFGLTHEQIHALADSGRPKDTVYYYSPISGTVISKMIQEGQYVDEGSVLYDLADLSRVWIHLDVYEKDLRFVKVGYPVRIRTDAWPGESFAGAVTFIDPVVNSETRTVRVRTEFDNSAGRLKPQMYVEAQIGTPSREALLVPASAVMFTGARNIVWVEAGENEFEPRQVVTGLPSGDLVEILGGLEPGDRVVTSGGYLIESESQLRTPAPAAAGHSHDGH